MTAASTLTDRYVFAVQRSLPEAQRAEIDRELRGTIADTIDGRIEAGTDPASAEREVITELGDPYRLAAGYADRPLHLIGPALFPDYIRLLKVLYIVVLPIVVAAILLGQLLSQPDDIGGAFGTAFGAIISVIAHFGFWTTLVFAIIERSSTYKAQAWNPSTLPQLPVGSSIKLSDTAASVAWMATILAAIAWGQFWPLFRDAGGAVIPFFDQALWSFWLPYFIFIALAELGFQLVLYRARRWTWPLALVNVVLGAAFAVPLIWLLLTEQLVNPAFLDAANIAPLFAGDGVVTIVLVVVTISTGLTDVVAGFTRAARGERRAS
ncbi:MAG: permease prefix domain 1-containing protein [Pseudolysinimonas sp.]